MANKDRFIKDIKKLLIDIEGYRDEYDGMKHQDGDKECEAVYQGKYEAYRSVANNIKGSLEWNNV